MYSIYDIIDFLFRYYGRISSTQIATKQEQLRQQVYDPTMPIDTIFNAINEQTWREFQTYLRSAREELKETMDLTASDTQYHQANMIQQIIQGNKKELIQDVEDVPLGNMDANVATTHTLSIDASVPSLQSEISSFKSTIAQMQQIQHVMWAQHNQFAQQSQNMYANSVQPPISVIRGTLRGSITPPPPAPAPNRRPKNWKYCWTHGVQLNHDSPTCKYKAQGHKDEATLDNRLDGNERGVNKYKRKNAT